jgi:hypothetical protein
MSQSFSAVSPQDSTFDSSEIKKSVDKIVGNCPFYLSTNQISLRYRASKKGQDPIELLKDGVGSLYDRQTERWLANESEFNLNNPLILGTYLETILKRVQEINPLPIGRFRIMRLSPKTCYSWHSDADPFRLHVPVVTNTSCFYLTEEGGMEQMLESGRLYKVNTAIHHTALNCSNEDRVHLVFSCAI